MTETVPITPSIVRQQLQPIFANGRVITVPKSAKFAALLLYPADLCQHTPVGTSIAVSWRKESAS